MQYPIYTHIFIFKYLIIFLFVLPLQAQKDKQIIYPDFYSYHLGDDTSWAQPQFNDSAWQTLKFNTFPHKSWQGVGWFRYDLEVDSTFWEVPLGITMTLLLMLLLNIYK